VNERLQKLIAHSGFCSRRVAEILIKEGRVTVDGSPAHLGQKIDPLEAHVAIDGLPLPVKPDLEYHLVNKPEGVVATVSDPQGRPTLVDLVPSDTRLYPVGRLDMDSAGLILLTNDGALTEYLTHPRYGVEKTYSVLVAGRVKDSSVTRLRQGVELGDGLATPSNVKVVDRSPETTLLEVVMTEGRNREVRRMCTAIGHEVITLFRIAIASLKDPQLKAGQHRPLTLDEIRLLYAAAIRESRGQ